MRFSSLKYTKMHLLTVLPQTPSIWWGGGSYPPILGLWPQRSCASLTYYMHIAHRTNRMSYPVHMLLCLQCVLLVSWQRDLHCHSHHCRQLLSATVHTQTNTCEGYCLSKPCVPQQPYRFLITDNCIILITLSILSQVIGNQPQLLSVYV